MNSSPESVDVDFGAENKKTCLEILRISSLFLTQNQNSMRNNLFPFLTLCVVGYVVIVPDSLFLLQDILADKAPSGIPVAPIAIALALIVIFMRFGFLLFHGLDLACSNKNLIVNAKFSKEEEDVLLQSFKDAYLIDTFLIFLNKPYGDGQRITLKRFAAAAVNIILNLGLLFSQYLVILAFCKKEMFSFSLIVSMVYFVLFFIFSLKVLDLPRVYRGISETDPIPVVMFKSIYILVPILSAFLSIYMISSYFSVVPFGG